MKFYLKIIAIMIGPSLIIFLGFQIYTSYSYCKNIAIENTNFNSNYQKFSSFFYSPFSKLCYTIIHNMQIWWNIPSRESRSLYSFGWKLPPNKWESYKPHEKRLDSVLIWKPTLISKMINAFWLWPANKQISLPQINVSAECAAPGLVKIIWSKWLTLSDVVELSIDQWLVAENIHNMFYSRPITISPPLSEQSSGYLVAGDTWDRISKAAKEQGWDALMQKIDEKPYVEFSFWPHGNTIYYIYMDNKNIFYPRISMNFKNMNVDWRNDRELTVKELNLTEVWGGGMTLRVASWKEEELINKLRAKWSMFSSIWRVSNCLELM